MGLLPAEGEMGKCFLEDKMIIFCEWFSKDKEESIRQVRWNPSEGKMGLPVN